MHFSTVESYVKDIFGKAFFNEINATPLSLSVLCEIALLVLE